MARKFLVIMNTEERKEFAKELASEMKEAAKHTRRPWWMSYGIPSIAIALMGWLAVEMYGNIKTTLLQNTATNQAQNESLAATAEVLTGLRDDLDRNDQEDKALRLELKELVLHARQDPFTGADAKMLKAELSSRIDKTETRVYNLEQNQTQVRIEAEKVRSKLESLTE